MSPPAYPDGHQTPPLDGPLANDWELDDRLDTPVPERAPRPDWATDGPDALPPGR